MDELEKKLLFNELNQFDDHDFEEKGGSMKVSASKTLNEGLYPKFLKRLLSYNDLPLNNLKTSPSEIVYAGSDKELGDYSVILKYVPESYQKNKGFIFKKLVNLTRDKTILELNLLKATPGVGKTLELFTVVGQYINPSNAIYDIGEFLSDWETREFYRGENGLKIKGQNVDAKVDYVWDISTFLNNLKGTGFTIKDSTVKEYITDHYPHKSYSCNASIKASDALIGTAELEFTISGELRSVWGGSTTCRNMLKLSLDKESSALGTVPRLMGLINELPLKWW